MTHSEFCINLHIKEEYLYGVIVIYIGNIEMYNNKSEQDAVEFAINYMEDNYYDK